MLFRSLSALNFALITIADFIVFFVLIFFSYYQRFSSSSIAWKIINANNIIPDEIFAAVDGSIRSSCSSAMLWSSLVWSEKQKNAKK